MKIINQPRADNIGQRLQDILNTRRENGFDSFSFMVAYVKNSGVRRIRPYLEKFKKDGGEIRGIIGVDKNTSFQGAQGLFSLCDELYIFHNEGLDNTFHPKVYFFEKAGDKAIVFIGSNNLTSGGLYTNYEVSSFFEYNLREPDEVAIFQKIKDTFSSYSDISSPLCKRVSSGLLEELKKGDYLSDEEKERANLISGRSTTRSQKTKIFGSESFKAPTVVPVGARRTVIPIPPTTVASISPHLPRGALVWKKESLPASDVQFAQTPTTHITGEVRLTKAGWKIGGKLIDQTRYFRYNLFGRFYWTMIKPTPVTESTKVLFDITILGKNIGQHFLEVRHIPSGEAGQHNFTTSISWGREVGDIIRKSRLLSKDLLMYAPPSGQMEPFFIEVV